AGDAVRRALTLAGHGDSPDWTRWPPPARRGRIRGVFGGRRGALRPGAREEGAPARVRRAHRARLIPRGRGTTRRRGASQTPLLARPTRAAFRALGGCDSGARRARSEYKSGSGPNEQYASTPNR